MVATVSASTLASPEHARKTLLISVAVTALLYVVPYGELIGYPLLLLSTLVHEFGHGIAALLVGGNFVEFRMFANASGVALHSGEVGRLSVAFIAAGGLVGPAVGAALSFVLAKRAGSARYALGALGAGLVIAEVAVVRGAFGMIFVAGFAGLCLLLATRASALVAQLSLVFIAVQLSLSVYSRADYLFVEEAVTGAGVMPSDVAHMASALGGPYWFWGGVCGAFSALALVLGGWYLLRSRPR